MAQKVNEDGIAIDSLPFQFDEYNIVHHLYNNIPQGHPYENDLPVLSNVFNRNELLKKFKLFITECNTIITRHVKDFRKIYAFHVDKEDYNLL